MTLEKLSITFFGPKKISILYLTPSSTFVPYFTLCWIFHQDSFASVGPTTLLRPLIPFSLHCSTTLGPRRPDHTYPLTPHPTQHPASVDKDVAYRGTTPARRRRPDVPWRPDAARRLHVDSPTISAARPTTLLEAPAPRPRFMLVGCCRCCTCSSPWGWRLGHAASPPPLGRTAIGHQCRMAPSHCIPSQSVPLPAGPRGYVPACSPARRGREPGCRTAGVRLL